MIIKRPIVGVLAMLILGEAIRAWAGVPVLIAVWITAAVVLAVFVRKRKIWGGSFFLLFFLLLGYFRLQEIQSKSDILPDGVNQITGKVNKVVEKEEYIQIYVYNATGYGEQGQKRLPGVILSVSRNDISGENEILPGDKIVAEVSLQKYEEARNPGNFNAKEYYETMNIFFRGWCDSVTVVSRNNNPVIKGIFDLKSRLKTVYGQIAEAEDSGVYQSLVLGDKSSLDATVKELYQANGIAHILAISGLHISILGMGLYKCLRKIHIPFSMSFLISSFLMISYGIMTGNNVSTVRALIMFLACIFADVLGRTYDSISALALAAVLLLVSYPKMLWNTGFLLSFLAVTGVCVVKPAAARALGNPENKLADGFLVSLSVTMTTLPVLLSAYYEAAVYAVLLNLIIIPLMTVLMISVVLAGISGLFSLTLGTFFVGTAHYILWFYQWVCRLFQKLPGAVVTAGKPEMLLVVIYYAVLAGFVFLMCSDIWESERRGTIFARTAIAGAVPVLCALCMTIHFRPSFFIRMLDVGQGEGIHIYAGGEHVLIDGGSSDIKNVGKYRLIPYLKSQGIERIRYVILTHADYDHYSGLLELMEEGSIGVDYLILSDVGVKSESFMKVESAAQRAGIPIKYVHEGTSFSCGRALFKVIYPEQGILCSDENDYSMVVKLSYGKFDALFTGDIGEEGEMKMLKRGVLEDIDLLKTAHHGSKYSTCEEFLDRVKPEFVLISCGEGNSYGHPHEELLERLLNRKLYIWRTSWSGAVTVTVHGGGIKVASYCNS